MLLRGVFLILNIAYFDLNKIRPVSVLVILNPFPQWGGSKGCWPCVGCGWCINLAAFGTHTGRKNYMNSAVFFSDYFFITTISAISFQWDYPKAKNETPHLSRNYVSSGIKMSIFYSFFLCSFIYFWERQK
jgi:hypothetical protein